MIELFTAPTPNGRKVSIALEEMELDYEVHAIDLKSGKQKSPDFLKINPNCRIPAILDDGFPVFESGAILLYLAEKHNKLLPAETKARSLVIQWLMWQMGGLGPMHGQANVFYRYFPEKIPAVIARYQTETMRLLTVMNTRLETHEFLAGDYSIADIACWPWVMQHGWAGLDISELPHLTSWLKTIGARPAVQRGAAVPYPQTQPSLETGKAIVTAA
jgi:glutathione S-transferase